MSCASITTVSGVTAERVTVIGTLSFTTFWPQDHMPMAANSAPASPPMSTSRRPVAMAGSAVVAKVLPSLATVNEPRTKPGARVSPPLPGAHRSSVTVSYVPTFTGREAACVVRASSSVWFVTSTRHSSSVAFAHA